MTGPRSPLRLWVRDSPPETPPLSSVKLLDRAWRARGLDAKPDYGIGALLPPDGLPDIDRAAERLADAVEKGESVAVVSDYDVDGVTGAATLVSVLRHFGTRGGWLLPNRLREGYGLSPAFANRVMEKSPDVVVTVDSGINAFEGAAVVSAKADLIVTDHHLPAASGEMPQAIAVVNPQREESRFGSRAACGCAVAFYLSAALRRTLKDRGHPKASDCNIAGTLDLVALATIADVVPLDANNRTLVRIGLDRIRTGKCRVGVRALAEVAGKTLAHLSESDFGYALGPRINAAGRLDDATVGVRLLLTEDAREALDLANELNSVNTARRQIERGTVEAAFRGVEASGLQWSCVVRHSDWHEGVVGIVASRVKDHFGRPTICFTESEDGRALKGSGRSVRGFHLKHALDQIAHDAPGLLRGYGGHAMAAGMNLSIDGFDEFCERFDSAVSKRLTVAGLSGGHVVDAVGLEAGDYTLETAKALAEGGPWGAGFESPFYADTFRVREMRTLKEAHIKLTVTPMDAEANPNGKPVALEMLNFGRYSKPRGTETVAVNGVVRAAFAFDVNRWQGRERMQLIAEHVEDASWPLEMARLKDRDALTLANEPKASAPEDEGPEMGA